MGLGRDRKTVLPLDSAGGHLDSASLRIAVITPSRSLLLPAKHSDVVMTNATKTYIMRLQAKRS